MHKIAILTTCFDDWGGCEELWARSIPYLQAAGFGVIIYKDRINRQHPRWADLATRGVELKELTGSRWNYLAGKIRQGLKGQDWYRQHQLMETFVKALKRDRPSLVVMAQSINFDGLGYAGICLSLGIQYVIVCQKVADFYWPPAGDRADWAARRSR